MQDGAIGTLSGSSQSAALVSGVAARLFQYMYDPTQNLSGAQVKNRIVATAVFSDALRGMTRSGVLDAGRALTVGKQVLVFDDNGHRTSYQGTLLSITYPGQSAVNSDLPFITETGESVNIDMCRIYRLSQDGNNNWTVVHQPRGRNGIRWQRIAIERDAQLMTSPKALEFKADGVNDPLIVPIRHVIEFYDKFTGEFACETQKG